MPDTLKQSIQERFTGAGPNPSTYDVHGVVTRVYADDHLLALAIQDFLRPFRSLPEANPDIEFYLLTKKAGSEVDAGGHYFGSGEILYDWQVLRYSRRGQLRYQEAPGAGSIVADLDAGLAVAFVEEGMAARAWSVAHLVFFPIWAQLLKTKGIFPLHAAGLERNGKGILFPGKSGCGKSTLALHLLRSGYRLLGDDTVFVRMDGKGAGMLFFPEVPLCSDMAGLNSGQMHAIELTEDRWKPKNGVDFSEVGAGSVIKSCHTDALVFPVIASDGRTRFEGVGQTEALAELILYAFLFMDPETSKENFALLAGLVQSARCFRLHMGTDGAEIAAAVDKIVAAS